MKMNHLLVQHEKFADQGLSGNLGDGYLMKHNRIFRRVREKALACGYQFSAERHLGYETFPLLQLESILQKKVIPFADNVVPFKSLTPAQTALLSWDDIVGNLKRNFVFHEAGHAVVHTLAKQFLSPVQLEKDLNSERRWALRLLLEESCANTIELLGVTAAEETAHRCFYELNSYILEMDSRVHLKNLAAAVGLDTLAAVMALCYLHANFLRPRIDDADLREILKFLEIETEAAPHLKSLRALAKVAFHLSERFRYQTTGFHLRLAGIKTPLEELFDFPLMGVLSKQPGTKEFVRAFAQMLVE